MKWTSFSKNNEDFFFCDKFINLLMYNGKKVKASKIFFLMLQTFGKKITIELKKKTNKENISPQQIHVIHSIMTAVDNIKPTLEVKKVRVAGSTYLVPAIVSKKKQQTLAMRWIIEAARKRKKNSTLSFSYCLAEEIFDAYKQQGIARQKRDELHRVAEANRAYVRYRWW
jgi:small subunit ribosomal protein S7